MTLQEMYAKRIQTNFRESDFRFLLKNGRLLFLQWESLRNEGEDILSEQFDQCAIDALARIGVTDDLLTWMYKQGRFTTGLEPDNGTYSPCLTFKVLPHDIGDFARVCSLYRRQRAKQLNLSLFEVDV